MTLRFSYARVAVRVPVWPLGGRSDRPRPIVPVSLTGPSGTVPKEALLDTGADDTVFHEGVAAQLGIDLTAAPTGSGAGVGGASVPLRYAQVRLRLTDGQEFREWPAWVGFTAIPMARGLLGFAGCLQFFTATFFGDLEVVELTINSLYPGT